MPPLASAMRPLGSPAPDFDLPDVRGGRVRLDDLRDAQALLVVFMCNHCPFVKHIRTELGALHRDYASRGLAMVGIASNDPVRYPQDGFDAMVLEAKDAGWSFAYLHDADQSAALAYGATCTPDFFLFGPVARDGRRSLVYRGQLDDSRPNNGLAVTGSDLRAAIDAVLRGGSPSPDQKPSIGCSIKWLPGRSPDELAAAR